MEFWDHLQMQLEHKGFCRVENKKNWYWQGKALFCISSACWMGQRKAGARKT